MAQPLIKTLNINNNNNINNNYIIIIFNCYIVIVPK